VSRDGGSYLRGVISKEWKSYEQEEAKTKADILRLWDAATAEMNELWPTIPAGRDMSTCAHWASNRRRSTSEAEPSAMP